MAAKRSRRPQSKRAKPKSKLKTKPETASRKAPKKAQSKRSKAPKTRKKRPQKALETEQAERMALLQLRIGRASHLYSMAAALSLAMSGIILLLTQPGRLLEDLPQDAKIIMPWLFPIVAGAFIATSAFSIKWKPYSGSRFSRHFLLTLLAFLISIGTLLLAIRQTVEGLEPQSLSWLYPASLSGISFTLISMAMTWRGLGRKKLLSMLSAAFPVAAMVYGFTPIFSAGIPPDLLILTFMGSAVAVLFSGSMLHITASSTSVQEKEVIRVSNDRLLLIREQLSGRAEALDYKEEALRSREVDVEVHEKALEERMKALEDNRSQLDGLKSGLDSGLTDVKKQEEKLRAREAELAAREETFSIRQQELEKKEKEFSKGSGDLSRRDSALAKKEKKLKEALANADTRDEELADKAHELKKLEKELAELRKQLDKDRQEVLEKEGELQVRESALEMKADTAALGKRPSGPEADLRNLEARLLEKEKELSRKEVQLRTTQERFDQASKKAEEWNRKAGERLQHIKTKERNLRAKEKALGEKEAELDGRWREVQTQLELLEESVSEIREKEDKYQELYKKTHHRATSVGNVEKELKKREASLEEREDKLEEIAKRLVEERDALTSQHQEVLKKLKDLEALESEVKLREMEMENKLKRTLQSQTATSVYDEREKALQLWEKRLKEKEREMKSRLYEREKELKEREQALREGLVADLEEEVEAEEEEAVDRIETGTPRLDDLLLGGIPMNSQILFVGPAFVGKEIGILNFIAEGLRSGTPCILVTTSRPPVEIAKDMGPILPSFREYEQLDLVRWIDGSSPMPGSKKKTPTKEGNSYVVGGAGDYEGILKAIEKIEAEFRKEDHGHLRLAYMTLSTSLTQGNEKEALSFVQRLVNRMRKTESVSIYAVERGMHADQQIEALEHQMDGAIHFKVDRQKNLLSVAGICDVQTRDWVEYKHTNRALMIGAFMLERIK